jgi:hypothetical protein
MQKIAQMSRVIGVGMMTSGMEVIRGNTGQPSLGSPPLGMMLKDLMAVGEGEVLLGTGVILVRGAVAAAALCLSKQAVMKMITRQEKTRAPSN